MAEAEALVVRLGLHRSCGSRGIRAGEPVRLSQLVPLLQQWKTEEAMGETLAAGALFQRAGHRPGRRLSSSSVLRRGHFAFWLRAPRPRVRSMRHYREMQFHPARLANEGR